MARIYDSSIYDASEKQANANPMIEIIVLHKDVILKRFFGRSELLFLLNGDLQLSGITGCGAWSLPTGHMSLIPGGTEITAISSEGALVITVRLEQKLKIPYLRSLTELSNSPEISNEGCYAVPINEDILFLVSHLGQMLEKGVDEQYYLDIKASEIFYMVSELYPEEVLARLFSPILSHRISFYNMVLDNFDRVKTVGDYARIGGYSLSSFEKKFRTVFGTSPYKWMIRRKAGLMRNALVMTDKSLKEISDEFGFSSLSQMNDFCKKHLGATPGSLRNKAPLR